MLRCLLLRAVVLSRVTLARKHAHIAVEDREIAEAFGAECQPSWRDGWWATALLLSPMNHALQCCTEAIGNWEGLEECLAWIGGGIVTQMSTTLRRFWRPRTWTRRLTARGRACMWIGASVASTHAPTLFERPHHQGTLPETLQDWLNTS